MNLKKNEAAFGAAMVAIAASLWGMDGVILTPRLYNLDVIFVVFVLHLVPFIIMTLFLHTRFKNFKLLNKEELLALFLVALFGGGLGTWAIVKALFLVNFQSLSIIVLLQKLQPIFAIGLAHFLLKEKLKNNFIKWASIALIASYFLSFGWRLPHFDNNANITYAIFYAILAAFSFGASTVLSKKVLLKLDFITATFFRYAVTSFILFWIVLFTGHLFDFKLITVENWIIIGIISLTSGSVAIFIYYYGLKKISAMLSTIVELFFPITAILLDYFINDQVLSPIQWISAVIMIFSIVKLNIENNK